MRLAWLWHPPLAFFVRRMEQTSALQPGAIPGIDFDKPVVAAAPAAGGLAD
jgi:hypothetical protein